jgi:anti-anti-sigma regulatory factor
MLAIREQDDVILDMRELVFADLTLIVDLAALSQRLRRRGKALLLCGAQPQVMSLIEGAGLDRLPGVQVMDPAPLHAAA